MRRLKLIIYWKQRQFNVCSVCSLQSHFIGIMMSYQIGSNLLGSSMISKGKLFIIKKSMTFQIFFTKPVEIYKSLRTFTKLKMSISLSNLHSMNDKLVSSMQSKSCLTLLHINLNRAGITPTSLMNLYTWSFGLSCCRIVTVSCDQLSSKVYNNLNK